MEVASALVLHRLSDRDGWLIASPQQFFNVEIMQFGIRLKCGIQAGDICLVMFFTTDLHSRRVYLYIWLKRAVSER
jgi:hypothetical protein